MFEEFSNQLKNRRLEKRQKLRERNVRLRAKGKDPLEGWNTMVDTGLGGLNKGGPVANGLVDITGQNLGTVNLFSDEQKKVAKEVVKRNDNKPDIDK